MRPILLSILLLSLANFSFSQQAKNGNYTVTGANTVLNAYTYATADIAMNATSITVDNNSLTNAYFTTTLAPGDLIMIVQMQGATMDISTYPVVGWGFNYTLANAAMFDPGNENNYRPDWGTVTNYNSSGKYEYAEVISVSGSTIINVRCALKNPYLSSGHIQVVRVPRLANLTLNPNMSIVPTAWNGTIGGVVALEVSGILNLGANSRISASGFGFRGGIKDNFSGGPAGNATSVGKPAFSNREDGGEKGESIGGSPAGEYATLYSRYGLGAPANGGGGGNWKNAGGGGGSNVGSGMYNGKGVPVPGYAVFWNLEQAGMATTPSSGGGRGGYSGAQTDRDEAVVGPNATGWGVDYRRTEGGLGGHPLTYDGTRVFMGGGGGAGEMDANQGGSGGNGGGIVFIKSFGTITGTGIIEANGENGQKSNPNNETPSYNPFSPQTNKKGVDGAGGAGGGGSVIISNGTTIPASIALSATGGNGGNNAISFATGHPGVEADGPGGGGGGGFVHISSSASVPSVNGGNSGVVITSGVTNIVANSPTVAGGFPPNGATNGSSGVSMSNYNYYNFIPNNASICSGNTANLSVTIQGALPAYVTNANIGWFTSYTGTTQVGTGLTFTTPVLTATTTYYVGLCPDGSFRVPVTVTVGGPTISGTAVVNNATCSSGGSITGLTTTGGAPTVTIDWNGVTSPTMNLSNASAGSYTVTVTDGIGCTATSGPHVIGSAGGPTINTTNVLVTNASCTGGDGSITGITATGTGLTYSWNGGAHTTLNISNLNAGSYSLTVTDNVGCTASVGPLTVGQAAGPSINTTNMVVAGTTCGLNNGAITGITATGTGLSYQWNGVTTTLNQANLASGNYNLVVTDNNGCTASHGPVAISASGAPAVNAAAVVITPAHCGQSNGAISGLTVSGGQTPYTYSWSPGGHATLNLAAVPAASYTLTVTDDLGCTATAGPFVVNDIAGPNINTTNVVITNETCGGSNGSITGITATGSGTLTYSWNLAVSPTLNHNNIPGGIYGLVVTDAFGCIATAGPFNVGSSSGPSINVTNMVVNSTTCGQPNGSITGITATGTGLTYTWNGTVSTSLDQTGLSAGNYTLVVTDANNCTATHGPIVIGTSAPGPVVNSVNVQTTPETCALNDGTISGLTATGTGPLTYTWNGTVSTTLNQTNLSPGNYNLVVTDANGCTANAGPFVVNAVVALSLDQNSLVITQTGCIGNTGSITGLQIVGGINPSVSWSNNVTTLNNTNLGAGSYTITVTDDQNCSIQETFTVTSTSGLTLNTNSVVVTNDNCGVGSGSISGITVSGGTLPYSYAWNSSPAQNTLDASNLTTGNYILTVTDNAGCQANATIFVGIVPPSTIDQSNVVITNESCVGNNGGISGILVTGNGPFTYSWSGTPLTTLNLTNLTAGTYTLTISDANGCLTTGAALTVGSGPIPNANFDISNPVASPGEIIVFTDASTGGPFVSYSWTLVGTGLLGTGSSVSYNSVLEGEYNMTLIVETADGCIDSITKPFQVFGELKIPNIVTANGDHTNDEFYITNLKPNTKLYIQNRWGNIVFATDNYKNDWGGIDITGEKLQDGVYFYQLITVDGKMWQGNVHLLID
ncbi:TQO small subunit DoxA [compost metagenome]